MAICRSGTDTKWGELSSLLTEIFRTAPANSTLAEDPLPYGAGDIAPPKPSPRQKLVIFTEHRDTLNYLAGRIRTQLGRENAVVLIHGSHEEYLHLSLRVLTGPPLSPPYEDDPRVFDLLWSLCDGLKCLAFVSKL